MRDYMVWYFYNIWMIICFFWIIILHPILQDVYDWLILVETHCSDKILIPVVLETGPTMCEAKQVSNKQDHYQLSLICDLLLLLLSYYHDYADFVLQTLYKYIWWWGWFFCVQQLQLILNILFYYLFHVETQYVPFAILLWPPTPLLSMISCM